MRRCRHNQQTAVVALGNLILLILILFRVCVHSWTLVGDGDVGSTDASGGYSGGSSISDDGESSDDNASSWPSIANCSDLAADFERDAANGRCYVVSHAVSRADCAVRCEAEIRCRERGLTQPAPVVASCSDGEGDDDDLVCCCGRCGKKELLLEWRRGGPIGARDVVRRKLGDKAAKRRRKKLQKEAKSKKRRGGKRIKAAVANGKKVNRSHHKKAVDEDDGDLTEISESQRGTRTKQHSLDKVYLDITSDGHVNAKAANVPQKHSTAGKNANAEEGEEEAGGFLGAGKKKHDAKTKALRARKHDVHPNDAEYDGDDDDDDGAADCRGNILTKYPAAECSRTKDKDECRARCEASGNERCQGRQGEIHKLNCKGEEPDDQGTITCCCSIKCETAVKTRARLRDKMAGAGGVGGDEEELCVDTDKASVKERLSELCRSRDVVFVARKYCLERMGGAGYFCVKNGHCFGGQCRGCIKHECQVKENKTEFSPPKEYVRERLRLGDFARDVAVNVDDMAGTEKARQWCTMLQDRSRCQQTCRGFGDRLCGGRGNAVKYDHDDVCRRGEKECKCCCQPVCRKKTAAATTNSAQKGTEAQKHTGDLGHRSASANKTKAAANPVVTEAIGYSDEEGEDDDDADAYDDDDEKGGEDYVDDAGDDSEEDESDDDDESDESDGDDFDYGLDPDRVIAAAFNYKPQT